MYVGMYVCMYLFILSSTLFLLAYVKCIFVRKLIKIFLKK